MYTPPPMPKAVLPDRVLLITVTVPLYKFPTPPPLPKAALSAIVLLVRVTVPVLSKESLAHPTTRKCDIARERAVGYSEGTAEVRHPTAGTIIGPIAREAWSSQ